MQMIRVVKSALAVLLLAAAPALAADAPAWVAKSNENAQVLNKVLARFSPEGASQLGIDGYDSEIFQLPLDINEQQIQALQEAVATLEGRLANETDPAVREDLEILITAGRDNIKGTKLDEKYNLPYFDLNQAVFFGIRGLLDDQVPAERRTQALVRLRKYAGMEKGYTPIATQAQAFIGAGLSGKNLRGPFKDNLQKDFANAPRYIDGIEKLFQKYGIKGYEKPYAQLKKQLASYAEFLHAEVEPRASTDFRLPEELYRFNLEQRGIDMPVEELVSRAKTSFREIQNEMQAIAMLVAKEKNLPSSDYRDVIRELKKKQLQGEAILPFYQNRIKEIEKLIREHDVVTLPDREMRIRIASEAEAAATPAPNMHPPRLIGNTGEMGEFVLPLRIPSEDGSSNLQFDDFTFDAASWTLTVHEGRPGHEMQFASIIEKGVSTARVLYAMNSVNAEGWALYMEAEMKPYEPLDGQLIALQHRLLRAARAFLDPGLQLGTITRDEAFRVLEHEVVLSHPMALQEVERYTFWAPGQAPSYFCGYSRLMELRTDAERMLGDSFNRREFHDFILSQGLLPPNLMRKAVMDEFVKPRMKTMEKPAA